MTFYVECTHTYHTELNTGIQRVVRNVVNNSINLDYLDISPVIFSNGKFIPINTALLYPRQVSRDVNLGARLRYCFSVFIKYINNIIYHSRHLVAAIVPIPVFSKFMTTPRDKFGLSWIIHQAYRKTFSVLTKGKINESAPVDPKAGDVLVLLDSSWHLDVWPTVKAMRRNGVKVIWVCYDIIPVSHSEFCDEHLVNVFTRWVSDAINQSDAVVCISKSTAQLVEERFLEMAPLRKEAPPITHFWLGSELDGQIVGNTHSIVRKEVRVAFSKNLPVYIFVGTIEPRKNHSYALDAFDILWEKGGDAVFLIAGRIGWLCDDLVNRIFDHDEFQDKLFMFNDLSDDELAWIYENANGLIFSSIVEGFGLPIVEALQRSLPVFASDIPVFKEIGAEGVQFFDLDNPQELASLIEKHIERGANRLSQPVKWLTWKESAYQFWERVADCLKKTDFPSA